jgi:thiol-disulfide isomerase/thioredoxin
MLSVPKLTRVSVFVGMILMVSSAIGETSPDKIWNQFKTARQTLPGLHQEFEVTRSIKFDLVKQVSRRQVIVDLAPGKWREQSAGGSGDLIRVFDGQNLFVTESGGTEYVRTKTKTDKEEPLPEPYNAKLEWRKAKEVQRLPCGFKEKDHDCVIIEAPVKTWVHQNAPGQITRMSAGISRIMIDTETGVWLECHTIEVIEGPRSNYTLETTYALARMSYAPADSAVFKLAEGGMREVKHFSPWDEARIKKQLVGKPAPELQVTDIRGNPISLSGMKGKTVLLDFWTTWCPPCQADGPTIEKLYQKYSGKDLVVIGISIDEDRETVEKFLNKHPHTFPVVLSSENTLPRPYQIEVFPTYLIIGPDGTLAAAEQDDQSFGRLRKILEKAGMATE